jgi:uncharacterized protein
MRLEDERESTNIEDRRGSPMRAGVRVGRWSIWAVLIAVVAAYFGFDPRVVMSLVQGGQQILESRREAPPADTPAVRDSDSIFIGKVLGNTEDVWKKVFAGMGQGYREPKLVLFSGATPSSCGMGQSAMGPFYCPPDQKVYVDLRFFDDLHRRYGASGDFARAYVLAHEVGHHVQNLLGIAGQVNALQQRSGEAQANLLSVRLELQADCLAGVWANRAHEWKQILEPGDVEEGLKAAAAVGDDTLQRRTQGYVVPESFTHGTSAERAAWFRRGLQSGDLKQCDTFAR